MRKKISIVISGLLAVSMLFTGCGKNTTKTDGNNAANDVEVNGQEQSNDTENSNEATNKQADIVVIGAGGAGMSAAIQASMDGATNVVILEKMAQTGGNTTRATGGLNASETKYQEADGIEDSNELFIQDTMAGGKNLNNPLLVKTLVENSAEAVDWVNEIGGDLSVVGMFGGASVKRIHRPSDTSAVGPMLVKTLNKQLEERNIPVLLETKAEKILVDEAGKVIGVRATNSEGEFVIDCKAVVLATGGFGANQEMVVKYNSKLSGFNSTNHVGATGDGITMAIDIGAGLVDIEQIQTHPTVDPDTQTMFTEGVRGNGAILVNVEGKRFINELETRDVVSAAILEQKDQYVWLVFDQKVRESLAAIEKYISSGIVVEADTLEELAEKTGMDAANFTETMKTYAGYAESGVDKDYERSDMQQTLQTGKFYAAKCVPAIHHTMGGVKINSEAQVLTEDDKVIEGLFAAGEVTGGVHGANRLGGNAVTDIVVFGRISGTSANSYVQANGGNTEPTIKVETQDGNVIPEVEGNYKDGTYTGSGKGNNGDITVEVTVEGGNVISIILTSHAETPGIYEAAEKNIVASIIKTQSTDVDVVSGATNSSNGIIDAVKAALVNAK
ncbi:MAG TPA: flavocytochrome c [Lachnoclostridium phytofermentans]|uniref:Urocanate reductase n=3 Tax=Lachnoclostridium TaxID=1506553 RepID=A0A3D2X8U3_9FIRM|nr:flavocytochrome c [Lachnoclostridium sp.]HCL02778.1 flavocytochrome c [Lachnoclostridium phytofermentans]